MPDDLVVSINYNKSTPIQNYSSLFFIFDEPNNGFLGITDKEIPILIGAAAGALGLLIIILVALLIWFCCQRSLKRDTSTYRLDEKSEKESISSRGSNIYNSNESVVFVGVDSGIKETKKDRNIKRSVSAPLHSSIQGKYINTDKSDLTPIMVSGKSKYSQKSIKYSYSNMVNEDDADNEQILSAISQQQHQKIQQTQHFQQQQPQEQWQQNQIEQNSKKNLNICLDKIATNRKALNNSLKRNFDDASENNCETSRITFSKRRKNRMRSDSAAAIALNKSGTNFVPTSNKINDPLIDNEAVVVYDERTAL